MGNFSKTTIMSIILLEKETKSCGPDLIYIVSILWIKCIINLRELDGTAKYGFKDSQQY